MLDGKKYFRLFQLCLLNQSLTLNYMQKFPVLIMDLGEIAHLPKPITPHVNFSSFVLNILLLDFSFPRWSVKFSFHSAAQSRG
jgi:hypothetical protein